MEYHVPLAVLAACGLVVGCSNTDGVDRRLRDLIREESAALSRESLAPARENLEGPVSAADRAAGRSKSPPTRNPESDELRYVPANESRDVEARLEMYARELMGPNVGGMSAPEAGSEADGAGVGSGMSDGASSKTPTIVLNLEESFRTAQRQAREFLSAEEDYLLSGIRLLIERHRWGPRLFNDTSLGISGSGDDGRFESAARLINELRVTQRLPAGGDVEARWVWDATEQLRKQATGRYRQSSALIFEGQVPLLRGAGDVAQEDLIQAERDVVYQARSFERFRRSFLVEIALDYFNLVQTKALIENQIRQIESLRAFERQTQALVEAGRKAQFELNDARNRLLNGVAQLANLRERYILQLDRYKVRLGLSLDQRVDLESISLELPEPETTIAEATATALEYRLDLQNERDRVDDARRGVRNARNNVLPDLNLNGSVSIPTDPDTREGGVGFDPEELDYLAGVTFGLPLDREIERLQVRQSIIRLEQSQRGYERARDNVVVSVRSALRGIDLARFQLRLAEEQVKITERRLEEQQLKADELDTRRRLEAEEDLLGARNARDQAKTDLRTAILNYLLESDQLRVSRDGTLQPLPGMELESAEPAGGVGGTTAP